MKQIADLSLGQTVYEAEPWDAKVYARYVKEITTIEQYEPYGIAKEPVRRHRVSGGAFGVGVYLDAKNWGKVYFLEKEEARRVCSERSLELKQERDEQIRKEIAELTEQLDDSPASSTNSK